jgi:hypothetical protein
VGVQRWAVTAAVFSVLLDGPALARPGEDTGARDLPFEECLLLIRDVGLSLGIEPTDIVATRELRLVRFSVSDGSLLVTCSRPDSKLVMLRSPIR